MLLAVPKYGRVKVNKILQQCRISPSKTIGGLSRAPAHRARRAAAPLARAPRSPTQCAPRLRHHRPVGGRQGHADPRAARARARARAVASRRPRARRGRASEDGVDYHFLTRRRSSTRRVAAGEFVEHADVRRPPLRDAALRARAPRRAPGEPGRARDRGPGRAPGPRGDARGGAGLHRAAVASRRCARGSSAAAPTTPRRSSARLRAADAGARRRRTSSPTSSSTTGSRTRSTSSRDRRERADAAERPRDGAPACDRWTLEGMISPRIDKLLEHVDSNYAVRASSPPSARGRSTATTTTSARARSTSSRRRWSRRARRTT